MKKHRIHIAITAFVWAFLLVLRVEAAGADSVKLDEAGTVTVVSGHAAQDRVCSLQLSLSVDAPEAETIEFQFQGSSAKVREFRYDREEKKLNLYMAGADPLFGEQEDTLVLGKVVALDRNGVNVAARVSVVADSLQYVSGTEVKTVEDVELPGTVQMAGSAQPTQPPAQTAQPTQPPAQTAQPTQAPPAQTAQPTQPPAQTAQPTQAPAQTPKPVQTVRPSQGSSGQGGQGSGVASESGSSAQEETDGTPVPGIPGQENGKPASGIGSEAGNKGREEADGDGQELEKPDGIDTPQEILVFAVVVGLILILTVVVTAVSYRIHRNSKKTRGREDWY